MTETSSEMMPVAPFVTYYSLLFREPSFPSEPIFSFTPKIDSHANEAQDVRVILTELWLAKVKQELWFDFASIVSGLPRGVWRAKVSVNFNHQKLDYKVATLKDLLELLKPFKRPCSCVDQLRLFILCRFDANLEGAPCKQLDSEGKPKVLQGIINGEVHNAKCSTCVVVPLST
jgi:hypothetical protein